MDLKIQLLLLLFFFLPFFFLDNASGFILGFKVNAFPLITDNYIDY